MGNLLPILMLPNGPKTQIQSWHGGCTTVWRHREGCRPHQVGALLGVFFDDVKNYMQRAVFGLVFAPRQLAGGAAGSGRGTGSSPVRAPFGVRCWRGLTSSPFGVSGAVRASSSGVVRVGSGRWVCSHTGCRGMVAVVSTAAVVPRCSSGLRTWRVPGRFFCRQSP